MERDRLSVRRRLILLVFSTTLFALTLLGVILIVGHLDGHRAQRSSRARRPPPRSPPTALEDILEAGGTVDQQTPDEPSCATRPCSRRRCRTAPCSRPASQPGGRRLRRHGDVDGDHRDRRRRRVHQRRAACASRRCSSSAISSLALGIAMLVAMFYARRITRPLEDFAEMAGRIATGDRRPARPALRRPRARRRRGGARPGPERLQRPARERAPRDDRGLAPAAHAAHRAVAAARGDPRDRRPRRRCTPRPPPRSARSSGSSGVVDEVVGVSRGTRTSAHEPFDVDELVASPDHRVDARVRRGRAAGSCASARPGLVAVGLRRVAGAGAGDAHRELARARRGHHHDPAARLRALGRSSRSRDEGPGVPAELDTTVFERSVSGTRLLGPRARARAHAGGGRRRTARDAHGATGGLRDVPARERRGGAATTRSGPGRRVPSRAGSDGGGERLLAGGLGVLGEHPAAVGPEAEQRAEARGRSRWR